MKGQFWVFEGVGGSGKTTQIFKLYNYLISQGHKAISTKEPGSTKHGITANIRKILLDPAYHEHFSFRAELLLYEADRAQHIDFVVQPAIKDGAIVISDRHDAASFAYQCYARNVCSIAKFQAINNFATKKIEPDFTFWLDIDPKVGLDRNSRIGKDDRFEREALEFHRRVREGYNKFFHRLVPPDKWCKFDAALSKNELFKNIVEKAENLL